MNDAEHTKDKRIKALVAAVLLLWLVLALVLGARETYVGEPGAPPLPILAGVFAPILVFLIAFWTIAGSFCLAGGNRRHGDRCHRPICDTRP
jgi:hypothetical protein